MRDTKPFASLSSGLLARKGAAKPAMRPQGFAGFGSHQLDDLGWNDMGHAEPAHRPDVAPLHGTAGLTPSGSRAASEPTVVAHQRALEHQFAAEPVAEAPVAEAPVVEAPVFEAAAAEAAPIVPMPRRRSDPGKGKAAFTLRLDTDRHLKLRLACALTRVSAQQLVTGALDDFLKSLPEVEKLAERVPADASGR
ncbi:hypothetical protein E2493_19070 [Sphingomonas parva]|uniref:Uncharacterized protein n=1 Tax=Sphingomonas parva TaxID=2555898 RepID=A0A4Y8ZKX2_9SPHN|nr:hypothetical protein [Sphingomonas parva]TFI56653.1 hypothetical protein E2493_19070 [Sphingomonas parva]